MTPLNKSYSFAVIAIIFIINSCNPAYVPLKGKYITSQSEIISTKSIDSTWRCIISLFNVNGLTVKTLDKKKGLLITTSTPFIPVYTFENKDGQLQAPQAWVILQKASANKKEWNPKEIYSQWSIQITVTGNDKTSVKIDPIVICTYSPNIFVSAESRGQSTGKLEELIRQGIK